MQEKVKILVTGGAGYIGSHTIIELLEKGFDVVSADNFSNSTIATYSRIRNITGTDVPHYDGDLCDNVVVKKIFADHPDIAGVIHFAAFKSVPESVAFPEKYERNNNGSLTHVIEASRLTGVRSFIFSSSCSVYGNISALPVSETTPLSRAESPYAKTKQDGEKITKEHSDEKMKCISLRYFNPVGAHESGMIGELSSERPNNLVPIITKVAAGKLEKLTVFGNDYNTRDGTCIRDYVHVCDIASAHILALEHLLHDSNAPSYDVINLGTGNGVTVLEAINAFIKVTGVRPSFEIGPRRAGDVEAIFSDTSKAQKVLNWKPRYSLEEMMSSAWKWQLHADAER